MAYLALSRKWRPQRFDEVVGQQHVLTGLTNALDQARLHHAYLFTGTRGVGKTTIARLFAKSLNCELGVSSQPCGQCANCVAIEQGNFIDLLEIDAASRTKVEDTRELLDNVQYAPARGRFKVYLIDEVHMLSRHSFNALLKTLEEPPEHVKFLLATTDPQKLPITVLSRCLQFQLKAMSAEQIAAQLQKIMASEGYSADTQAIGLLAEAADGSMRDALSLSDQALNMGGGALDYQSCLNMLGRNDPKLLHDLLAQIMANQAQAAFNLIEQITMLAPDFDMLHQQFAEYIHALSLAQVLESHTLHGVAKDFDPQLLQLFYQIILSGRRDLAYAPSPRSGFEMTVLRLLAFKPAAKQPQVLVPQAPLQEPVQPSPMPQPHGDVVNTQVSTHESQNVTVASVQSTVSEAQPRLAEDDAALILAAQQEQAELIAQAAAMTEASGHEQAPYEPAAPASMPAHPNTAPHTAVMPNEAPPVAPQQEAVPSTSPTAGLIRLRSQLRAKDGVEKKPLNTTEVKPNKPALVTAPVVQAPVRVSENASHIDVPASAVEVAAQAPAATYNDAEFDAWGQQVEQLQVGPMAWQLLSQSVCQRKENVFQLYVRSEYRHLAQESYRLEIEQHLSQLHGQQLHVELQIKDDFSMPTPSEQRQQIHQTRLFQATQRLQNDPHVQLLCERFGAELDEQSVTYET